MVTLQEAVQKALVAYEADDGLLMTTAAEAMREALEAEQPAEPVAWMAKPVMNGKNTTVFCSDKRLAMQWDYGGHPEYGHMLVTPVYTHTQPAQQPLTAEQMNAWVKNAVDLAYAAGAEAERKACATINVESLRILAGDGPGTAILKYRAAIRARK